MFSRQITIGSAPLIYSPKGFRAVKRLLEAIYEQDFLACSYGYRPSVGARTAVDEVRVKLQFGGYLHVVEADIKGFDNLSHEWLCACWRSALMMNRFCG